MKRIALFASGNGSNAEAIIQHFRKKGTAEVVAVFCNKPDALVLERCKLLDIPSVVFSKADLYETNTVLNELHKLSVDFIVLAGFLWLVPESLINQYPNRIINIHPALLPKYGGKGMYGAKVHEAVVAGKEVESGISIHLVNKKFDEGRLLFQHKCLIEPHDTPELVASKVRKLEHEFFPSAIELYIKQFNNASQS